MIEPAAGADRATLAFLCEAYHVDEAPDEKGKMQSRTVMRFHPRLAPIKAAVFPLIKKDGMPENAAEIYRELKRAGIAAYYDQQAAIGRRYRRQDEIGTPFCITVDGETSATAASPSATATRWNRLACRSRRLWTTSASGCRSRRPVGSVDTRPAPLVPPLSLLPRL